MSTPAIFAEALASRDRNSEQTKPQNEMKPSAFTQVMSIFDLSEAAANSLYNWSNVTVLIASIAGVCGAIGLFWAGGVKDKYGEIKEGETQTKIAQAQEGAALANERTAGLEKEAAQARLELEQIKERQRWRKVSSEQETKIVDALRGAERGSVEVSWIDVSEDGQSYAGDLFKALEKAGGFHFTRRPYEVQVFFSGDPIYGLITATNRKDNKVAFAIQNALREAGIDAPGELNPDQKEDVILKVFRRKLP